MWTGNGGIFAPSSSLTSSICILELTGPYLSCVFWGGRQSHSSSFSSMSSGSSWFGRSLPLYMGLISPPATTSSSSWSPRHGCTHYMHQDAEASSRILGIFYILSLGDGAILCLDPRLVSLFVYVGSKFKGVRRNLSGATSGATSQDRGHTILFVLE